MVNGYPVHIHDTVFVLGVGAGTVTAISADGGFTVKTGQGESHFRDGGYLGNQRRVYWSDPILLDPPKDHFLWTAFVEVVKVIYKNFTSFPVSKDAK